MCAVGVQRFHGELQGGVQPRPPEREPQLGVRDHAHATALLCRGDRRMQYLGARSPPCKLELSFEAAHLLGDLARSSIRVANDPKTLVRRLRWREEKLPSPGWFFGRAGLGLWLGIGLGLDQPENLPWDGGKADARHTEAAKVAAARVIARLRASSASGVAPSPVKIRPRAPAERTAGARYRKTDTPLAVERA